MTSRERVLAAAIGKEPDILPVASYMGNHGARVAGEKLRNYYTNPRKLAEAQLKAWEIYGQDVIVAQSDNYYMAEAFGCRVKYHENSTPTVERTVIHESSDIAKLKHPNPQTDGRMPVYLEAIHILSEEVNGDIAIRGCGTGPFVMAGHLMGPEKLIMELANIHYNLGGDEQALLTLFDLTCETLIDFVKLQLEAGATIVQCADIVAVDHKADLREAKKIMGDRVCLIGNLDPSAVLLLGTPEDVEREARLCIEKAAAGGGYILGSGCEVAVDSPVENIKTMIRVARELR